MLFNKDNNGALELTTLQASILPVMIFRLSRASCMTQVEKLRILSALMS